MNEAARIGLKEVLVDMRRDALDLEQELIRVREEISVLERVLAREAKNETPQTNAEGEFPILKLGRPQPALVASDDVEHRALIRSLRGLAQPQALVEIAKANGGVLRTADAKNHLIEAGLVKGYRNVSGHIFSLLRDGDRFAKLGVQFHRMDAGVYRMSPIA